MTITLFGHVWTPESIADREWKRLARRLGNGAGGYDPREAFAQLVTKIRG